MARLKAKNDALIDEFLADPNYRVDPDGKVYRLRKAGWIEVGRLDKEGYREIWYRGKRLKAHRVVYRKYVGPLDREKVVDHKDREPGNNAADNLGLETPAANNEYRYRREQERKAEHAEREVGPTQEIGSDNSRAPFL